MEKQDNKNRFGRLPWEDWRKRIREKVPEKWLRRDNLIVLVLLGVLLLIVAIPMEKGGKENGDAEEKEGTTSRQETEAGSGNGEAAAEDLSEEEYARLLEQRLEQALSQVAGVGRVQVMITLRASKELVVEREAAVTRQTVNETDAQGGSRVTGQVEAGDSVVYRSVGSDSEPYVVKTVLPEVEGVLVVAQGAGDIGVKRTVIAIVQALFDVEAHKVSVVKMETK